MIITYGSLLGAGAPKKDEARRLLVCRAPFCTKIQRVPSGITNPVVKVKSFWIRLSVAPVSWIWN